MTEENIAIASLAMDLKRVAMGFYRGSNKTAMLFCQEALKRRNDIKKQSVKPYIRKFLNKLPGILSQKDEKILAEDALMYSTIFQNYVLYRNDLSST